MIVKLYVVYDCVAKEAGPLQPCKNNGVAWRMYEDALRKSVAKDDFVLYCVGKYDTEEMRLTPQDPEKIVLTVDDQTLDEELANA